jgi:hypothetical protein
MKFAKRLLTVSTALIGMALALDLPLHAQTLALRVNIPFEFHAGNTMLPAGTYIVEKRGDAILISDGKGHDSAVLANPTPNKAFRMENMVVFKRYGDTHFLTEIRWRDYSTARGLLESPAQRSLAKAISAQPVNLAGITR